MVHSSTKSVCSFIATWFTLYHGSRGLGRDVREADTRVAADEAGEILARVARAALERSLPFLSPQPPEARSYLQKNCQTPPFGNGPAQGVETDLETVLCFSPPRGPTPQ